MDIKFIGTGGAFEPHKGNSAAIIEVAGKRILIDCGYTVFSTLLEKQLTDTLDYILITHLHGDHVGSLPTLVAYMEIKLGKELPILTPTTDFQTKINTFLNTTYEAKRAHYIPLTEIPEIGFLDTFGQHMPDMQTFSYYFTENDHLIYYSGDINNTSTANDFLQTRTEKTIEVFHEVSFFDGPMHVHYKAAAESLQNYSVYYYHVDGANKPADCTLALVEEYPKFLA